MEKKSLKLFYRNMETSNAGRNKSVVYFIDDSNDVYKWEVNGVCQSFIDFALKDFSDSIMIKSFVGANNELLNVTFL